MPTSRAGTFSNPKGFTLVELGVVLLVLALFSGLVLPNLLGLGERGLSSTAGRLSSLVKYLYNEAALTGLEHRLIFDLDAGTFEAARVEENGELRHLESGPGKKTRLPENQSFREVRVAGRGSFSRGDVSTWFYPVGWLDETLIHLKSTQGDELTLRLSPLSGTTEIHEGYDQFD